jgi:NAD(P)-dependent dehydrogenase (short-subunit alcohol dehydrogenase family)
MMNHRGQRVLITAAASGIGFAVAEAFIADGARVHICDMNQDHLNQAKERYPELGTTLADAASPEDVKKVVSEAKARLGGLDVLINNVGIAGPTALLENVEPQDWDRTMRVNVGSHFYFSSLAIPLLKASGGGCIINMSSIAGRFGYPWHGPYAVSKAAVIALTNTLAMELGQYNIRVNTICPCAVDGPRMGDVIRIEAEARNEPFEQIRDAYHRQNSMRTFIQKQDIASMILYLTSSAGNKISGQAISIDGNAETGRI